MPDQTTTTRGGLFTAGGDHAPVPLAGVSVEAEIHGFFARVVVAQRYVNRESNPIEAVYVFPLDEGAAVCGFEAVVDGTLVVGEVRERDEAFERYDDAMQEGHGAFLLDEERPDVFQASIGNLLPGKEVEVRLTYVTELSVHAGRLRFVIPTTVSPRYAPAGDRTVGRQDAEALNPPVAFEVPYGLTLSVAIAVPGGISGVESPSHPIAMKIDGEKATVSLAQYHVAGSKDPAYVADVAGSKDPAYCNAALDRDFVLSVDAPALHAPLAVVERTDEGTEVIGVAFTPTFEGATVPAEIIFIVDRSGSMAGTSILEARNALQLCLRSMTKGCRFNIIGFGTKLDLLFPSSRRYDKASLEAASRHVADMEADLGGTEILPALKAALMHVAEGLPKQIVVLTDGEVTNTDEVIALARAYATQARIFTFGVGAGASHHLVRGLARAGRGAAEFIYPGERIEPKMLRQFARLLSPALTNVEVEWVGGTVTQAPTAVPTVFADGRLSVYGFVKDGRPSAVRLTATAPSGPVSFDVPVPAANEASLRSVAPLAARARIRELEESAEWLNTRGSRQTGRKAGVAQREIITLSTRYGIISRETSYVAVERREKPGAGEVQLRRVPIALTAGWGKLRQVADASQVPHAPLSSGVVERASFGPRTPKSRRGAVERASGGSSVWMDCLDLGVKVEGISRELRDEPGTLVARYDEDDLRKMVQALARQQHADGSWELTPNLAWSIGGDLDDLRAQVDDDPYVHRVWATALALAWLEENAPSLKVEWQMLASKAAWWVENPPAPPPGGGSWMEFARSRVQSATSGTAQSASDGTIRSTP